MQSGLDLDNYISGVLGSILDNDIGQSLLDYSEKLVDTTLESSNLKEVGR